MLHSTMHHLRSAPPYYAVWLFYTFQPLSYIYCNPWTCGMIVPASFITPILRIEFVIRLLQYEMTGASCFGLYVYINVAIQFSD